MIAQHSSFLASPEPMPARTRYSTGVQSSQALRVVTLFGLLSLVLEFSRTGNAQVLVEPAGTDHVSIQVNGRPFTDFYIGPAYAKPFFAPLRSAAGQIVTRRFPMEQAAGETHDHPHHKGLWIGYGDVNGINFWEVEPQSSPSGDNPKDKGTIRLVKLNEAASGKKSGSVTATFAWLGPHGQTILNEERTIQVYADKKIRRLDVDTTFRAPSTAKFGDTKEGFFAIRVADSMTGKNGGILTNSEGSHTEKDVWGKQADWVDYVGAVEGQRIGILIFDNPHNPNHPPRWHARDYGLFAVNPFGITDFDPKTKSKGGYSIPQGQSARFRYRVIIHNADVSRKEIARWYSNYAKGSK